ncbi:MAG: hydantoinase/oxoprolinase family protein [Synergistaceae bacterium]|nr:hydantoinase/oxoprolinase family protein [Synergistaceae bacterium]
MSYDNQENDKPATGILGIDAGGTFTDLVFISGDDMRLRAKVKTPTEHNDLISTIRRGINLILGQVDVRQVRSVNLATTLATNAIVEDKLRPVGLILIGYDEDIVERAVRNKLFGTNMVACVAGGHDPAGNELEPLDMEALEKALEAFGPNVEGIAISGYFSVRNTAHELRAMRAAQEKLPHIHVTCGHELASELDAIKRATTTVLNAGLIPIVMDLLASVEQVCHDCGMDAPVTVVRGDGSLVGAEWAKSHPVEMILSGPAGSACGACFLASSAKVERDSWVVDIGGTTTDIIHLAKNGKPILLQEGATVGNHKTLVKAIDIYTFGLGGDSRVHYDRERKLSLGPRRVRPLCSTAVEYPGIVEALKVMVECGMSCEPLIILPGRGRPESSFEKRVTEKLAGGPQPLEKLLESERTVNLCRNEIEQMESRGVVVFASFTPTDALHILGRLDKWNGEASRLGAILLSYDNDKASPELLAERVCRLAEHSISSNVFYKSMTFNNDTRGCGELRQIIDMALDARFESGPQIALSLCADLVGVGAPTWAFIKDVGKSLNTEAIQPVDADVAGAIGAAVGSFSLHYAVRITPHNDGIYRVHHPLGITDYDDLETAVAETRAFMKPWIVDRAKKAGAKLPTVECERMDEEAVISGGVRKLHLWTQLSFTVFDEKDTSRR